MSQFVDYYAELQVSPSAEREVIEKAYKALIFKYHPDRGGDEARTKRITAAYYVLSDSTRRAEYDEAVASYKAAAGSARVVVERGVMPADIPDAVLDAIIAEHLTDAVAATARAAARAGSVAVARGAIATLEAVGESADWAWSKRKAAAEVAVLLPLTTIGAVLLALVAMYLLMVLVSYGLDLIFRYWAWMCGGTIFLMLSVLVIAVIHELNKPWTPDRISDEVRSAYDSWASSDTPANWRRFRATFISDAHGWGKPTESMFSQLSEIFPKAFDNREFDDLAWSAMESKADPTLVISEADGRDIAANVSEWQRYAEKVAGPSGEWLPRRSLEEVESVIRWHPNPKVRNAAETERATRRENVAEAHPLRDLLRTEEAAKIYALCLGRLEDLASSDLRVLQHHHVDPLVRAEAAKILGCAT